MEGHEKLFVAYSKKLLRSLNQVKTYLDEGNTYDASKILDELIVDTKTDIEDGSDDNK